MKTKLFQPDIFSESIPKFVPAAEDVSGSIITLLRTHYLFESDAIKKISRVKGNEVNSNNFKVETTSGSLLVKRNGFQKNISELNKIFKLTNWLFQKEHLFFKIVPSRNGNLVAEESGCFWCVSEFIAGRYFSGGSMDEIKSAGRRIGLLHAALRTLPHRLQPEKKISLFPEDAQKILNEVFDGRNKSADIFTEEERVIIEDNRDSILSAYKLINFRKEEILRSEAQVCHIDLHPHNILIGGNKTVTFIDPDSLMFADPRVAIAFSIYKLIKQSSVAQALCGRSEKISECAKGLFFSIQEMFPFTREDALSLYLFALSEIFRRILIIFRLSLYEKNKSWNHVLPMHLSGIKEVEIIFSSIV